MISEIRLKGFRLFQEKSLKTNNSLVILSGDNATGKTSILEAIYLCSTSKSHRTTLAEGMILDGEPFARVDTLASGKDFRVVISKKGKSYFIDDKEIMKAGEFIGNLSVVMSSPLDIYLINGSKGDRRRFLDLEISLYDKHYLNCLSKYKKLLNERNNLLKSDSIDKILLDVLTDELISENKKIYNSRVAFIDSINSYLEIISKDLNIESIKIKYLKTYDDDIKKSFNSKLELDKLTRVTNIGAHRDDFKIYINGKDSLLYASEGQMRIICIAIKLALMQYKTKIMGIEPILLLDDVFAALDSSRIARVVKYVKRAQQAFITTTSINEIPKDLIEGSLVLKIER